MKKASVAVVFLSNGPGELSTWVKPLAENMHKKIKMRPKYKQSIISFRLTLVPCPNATGNENFVANNWNLFDKVTKAKDFWKLLFKPKSFGSWPNKGVVVFLGGDQFWSVLLSARLGYKHMTYAEWISRWPQWNDKIVAMSNKVKERVPKRYRNRCIVVGDLMADLSDSATNQEPLAKGQWVALMPGSKSAKLSVGVPFLLEAADQLASMLPDCNFLIPVAPTTSADEIKSYLQASNPIAKRYSSKIHKFIATKNKDLRRKFITKEGTEIYLHEKPPAHNILSQCDLALTTVGANTAELGALNVPMIVIVPTQHMDVMQAWDGLLGLLGRLPFIKILIGWLISLWRLRKGGFLAWPNISAGRMIVPEKVGKIQPREIAEEAMQWLASKERLMGQKEDLRSLRGQAGAVDAMTSELINLLPKEVEKFIN